jgi:hypothetical protein
VTSEVIRKDYTPRQARHNSSRGFRQKRAERVTGNRNLISGLSRRRTSVERGPRVDLPGHPDGQRAILLFGNEARAEVVLWFKGNSRLHIIESTSLAHSLGHEKLIEIRIQARPPCVCHCDGSISPWFVALSDRSLSDDFRCPVDAALTRTWNGSGGGLASHVFEVVHQGRERLVEVFVAIALQYRELHMFSQGP